MSTRDEVRALVKEYVAEAFGGDYRRAFDHADADKDGKVTRDELTAVLREAGVGNFLTRGLWAREAMKVVDLDSDGGVSWEEFSKALQGG